MLQIQEYADRRNQQETKAIQKQKIQAKWEDIFRWTPESLNWFPWGQIKKLLKEDISLDQIWDAFVESYEWMEWRTEEKALACKNIFNVDVNKFLRTEGNTSSNINFSEYLDELDSVNATATIWDVYWSQSKEIADILDKDASEKRKQKLHKKLWKEYIWEFSDPEMLQLAKSKQSVVDDIKKWFSPIAELKYLANQRGQYNDYLVLDIPWRWVMRSYNQVKSNLRYMHDADFIHFPSAGNVYIRLQQNFEAVRDDDWKIIESFATRIVWPTGTWKTEVWIEFAREKTGKDPIIMKCNPENTSSELKGKYTVDTTIVDAINFAFIKEWFQKAQAEDRMIILDEFDKLPWDLKWDVNWFLDELKKKWATKEVAGDGWDKMTIGHHYFVIATMNYGDKYSQTENGSDDSTLNRFERVEMLYPTEQELWYHLLSKIMNRRTLEFIGDEDANNVIWGIPKVMSKINATIQRSFDYTAWDAVKDDILKLKNFTFRDIKRWLNHMKNGNWTLKEFLYQTINQYEMDQQVQKLFVISLLIDANMLDGFAEAYPNDKAKLTWQSNLITRISELQGKDEEIDEMMSHYMKWYAKLEDRPERTYRANALDFAVKNWHQEDLKDANGAELRDKKRDELIWRNQNWWSDEIELVETATEPVTWTEIHDAFENIDVIMDSNLEDHQNAMKQRAESQDKPDQYLKVMTKAKELIDTGKVRIGSYNGFTETIDTLTGRAYRHEPMKAHPNWTDWEYSEWSNAFKKLSAYSSDSDRSHWFYNADKTKDIPLIYKWAIDGTHNETFVKEFQQILKEDVYEKWYERCTKEQYQESMNELFPNMNESEQILWMSFITWQQWRYRFQQVWECNASWNFTNKSSWQSRSFVGSLAYNRLLSSWFSINVNSAILPSRSVSG